MSYPVRFEVDYPERLSRGLIFVKWLLAIPHFIVLYVLGIAIAVVLLIVFFAILFTKRYPRGLFDFVVMVQRWSRNVTVYASLLRDEYPPFSGDAAAYPPARLEFDYPESPSRWMPLVKWLLAIPHFFVLTFLGIAVCFVLIVAWFAILFTGRFPRGLFDFVVGTTRWSLRVNAYATLLTTDVYPPFSLD
jgi:hypothetical protein